MDSQWKFTHTKHVIVQSNKCSNCITFEVVQITHIFVLIFFCKYHIFRTLLAHKICKLVNFKTLLCLHRAFSKHTGMFLCIFNIIAGR